MKNELQIGDDRVEITAPYARSAGQGVLVGSLFVICTTDAASGEVVAIRTSGAFSVTANTTDTTTVGALLYWDDTNKRLTTTVGTNKLVGVALNAKTNGQTVVSIKLNNAATN